MTGDNMITRRQFMKFFGATVAGTGFPVGSAYANHLQNSPYGTAATAPRFGDYANIKMVGIGGAGCNTVEHMIRTGMPGVEFICINTDSLALTNSSAPTKLQLGSGVGTSGRTEIGMELANASREQIAKVLNGTDLLFVTAGMGGGTGTGASPVVAEVARELGILTVAVVTKPFKFEGRRNRLAVTGVAELERHADSTVVVLNERLLEVLGDDVSMFDAFRFVDNVLMQTVGGVAGIVNVPGLLNVDFDDVRFVMGGQGRAVMGTATASGAGRGGKAAEIAITNPLLEDNGTRFSRGVLVNVTASSTFGLTEYKEVLKTVRKRVTAEAKVFCGAVFDESMGDRLQVIVIAK